MAQPEPTGKYLVGMLTESGRRAPRQSMLAIDDDAGSDLRYDAPIRG